MKLEQWPGCWPWLCLVWVCGPSVTDACTGPCEMRVCCEALRLRYWPARVRQGSAFAFAEGPWERHGTGGTREQRNPSWRRGDNDIDVCRQVGGVWMYGSDESRGCRKRQQLDKKRRVDDYRWRTPQSRLCRGQLPIMHTLIVTAQVAADNAFWQQQQDGLHVDVSPAVKSSPLRL